MNKPAVFLSVSKNYVGKPFSYSCIAIRKHLTLVDFIFEMMNKILRVTYLVVYASIIHEDIHL